METGTNSRSEDKRHQPQGIQGESPNQPSDARVASAQAEAPDPLQGSDYGETTCKKLLTISDS
jgi:hypothetical protein